MKQKAVHTPSNPKTTICSRQNAGWD